MTKPQWNSNEVRTFRGVLAGLGSLKPLAEVYACHLSAVTPAKAGVPLHLGAMQKVGFPLSRE